MDDLLADATARPALNTLEHIPGHHRLRCADIFRDLFSSHAAAEKAATKGGAAAHAHALRAARLLWAAPALLLRTCRAPRDDVLSPPTAPATAKGVARANIVRARLQHAEVGDWEKLLSDYLVDRAASDALALARARGHEHASPLEAQPDEDASVFMKASAKVEGHALRSATDLLLGARRAPLDENTAREVDSLVAVPITREEEFNQRAALADAKALSRHVAPVPHRLVRRRLRLAKLAAQPGPSGWRNGFLAAVGEARGGVAALSRWADVWRRAMVIPDTAALWTAACVCPLDAGSAAVEPGAPPKRKIRPIALAEAPLKLVEGAAVDMELSALLHVLEPRQLGCGTPDGAGLVVALMRAWAADDAAEPDIVDPMTQESLDLENAYGRAFRSTMVAGAVRMAPGLAPLYAAQWQGLATTAWQRCEGAWRATSSARGGWQGSRAMMVGFCLGLEETFRGIPVLDRLRPDGRRTCVRLGYQDDTYLVAPASFLAETWDALALGLDKGGHRLRASKCAAWAPSCSGRAPDQMPDGIKALAEHITINDSGFKLLGGSVGGDLEFDIDVEAVGLAPARKRAARATQLAARIEQFVTASPTPQAAHHAWFLVSKCCAHALSFDSRLVPSGALAAVEEPVWAAVRSTVNAVLSVTPNADAARRMQLGGSYGGCGLRRETAGSYSDGAFYSAWATNAPRARMIAATLGRPLLGAVHGAAEADEVRARLATAGVLVSRDGDVILAPEHAVRYVASAWHADQPLDQLGALPITTSTTQPPAPADALQPRLPRRFVSRIWRHLDAVQASALWHSASPAQRVVMLSAGGTGAGNMWVQLPLRVSDFFDNSHFRAATLLRLVAMDLPSDSTCRLVARYDETATVGDGERRPGARYEQGRACGQPLGRNADHALLCKAGPARLRPHQQLAAALASSLRAAGAHVDLERVVPELMNRGAADAAARDAVLDLVVSFPGSFEQRWLDVSIRCPLATRYSQAPSVPGSAASKGAEDKLARYGPKVLPLVFESFGRLGTEGKQSLQLLALQAGACAHDHWAVQRLLPRWQAALERAVHFATAEVTLLAMGANVVHVNGAVRA